MKKLAFLFVLVTSLGFAQTVLTIPQLRQSVSSYTYPNDTSTYQGQDVTVRGVVVFETQDYYQYPVPRYAFWLQDSASADSLSGLQIFMNSTPIADYPALATTVASLTKGQYVEVTGKVDYFQGEVELVLDAATHSVNVLSLGVPIAGPTTIPVSDLNDNTQTYKPSGNRWEGVYVRLDSLEVLSASTSPTRGFYTCQDAAGNQIRVYDLHIDMRPNQNGFVLPAVGSFINVQGVIRHVDGSFSGFPVAFEINPTDSSDVEIISAPPSINSVTRSVACPGNVDVVITANVEHVEQTAGTDSVENVILFYSFDGSGTTNQLTMSETTPGVYQATIPASYNQTGRLVYYWVEADDYVNNDKDVFPVFTPKCYTVNPAGCRISDIQRIPNLTVDPGLSTTRYESGYDGETVTVPGIVTASRDDLGYVFIQEPGKTTWAGIQVIGDACIDQFDLGDSVLVTGTVDEFFGFTQIVVTSCTNAPAPSASITPVQLDADVLKEDDQTHATEAYEAMLLRLEEPGLKVVEVAQDSTTGSGQLVHAADYRVGTDAFDPLKSTRIIAGKVTSNVYSSLNFSFVADTNLAFTDGLMLVPACLVQAGATPTTLDWIQGIVFYQWNRNKIAPRNNDDISNVQNAICVVSVDPLLANLPQLSLYPNPASNFVQLSFDGQLNTNRLNVSLVDLTGRTLLSETLSLNGSSARLNLGNLVPGTYMVRVLNGTEAMYTAKLVVVQ